MRSRILLRVGVASHMKLSKTRKLSFAIVAMTSFSLVGCLESNAGPNTDVGIIEKYIADHYKNSRLMKVDEINTKSCNNYGAFSTIVEGDFNNDDKRDYAFLVVTNIAESTTKWAGAELRRVNIELIALIDDSQEQFKGLVLERLPSYLPSDVFIQLKKPGTIKRSDGSVIELSKPGINRIYCEKSESLFYWDKAAFQQTPISD